MVKQNNLKILILISIFILFGFLFFLEIFFGGVSKQSVEVVGRSQLDVSPTCAYFFFNLGSSFQDELNFSEESLNAYFEFLSILNEDSLFGTSSNMNVSFFLEKDAFVKERNIVKLEVPLSEKQLILNFFNYNYSEGIVLEKVFFDVCDSEKKDLEIQLVSLAGKQAKENAQKIATCFSNDVGPLLRLNSKGLKSFPIIIYDFEEKKDGEIEFYLEEERDFFQSVSLEVTCLYELI
jgi:hypothetical protein